MTDVTVSSTRQPGPRTSSAGRPIAEPGSSWSATATRRPSSPSRRTSENRCSHRSLRVQLLAGPDDCAFVDRPRRRHRRAHRAGSRRLEDAPGKRGVVVQGRYAHVSFIVDPAPLRVTVREVVPPYPPKLLDQARRVLEVAEHLPPIELVPEVVEFDRARAASVRPPPTCCPAAAVASPSRARPPYLDERPDREAGSCIGCERSQQIHESFYGERAPTRWTSVRGSGRRQRGHADQVLPARGHNEVDAEPTSRRALGSVAGPDRRGAGGDRPRVGADVGTRLSDSQQYAHLWGTDGAGRSSRSAPGCSDGWTSSRAGSCAGSPRS